MSARGGERGHAAVVVALGAITLLALVGLAIDGGMAAGAYRHAQNAADAGALAAARQELLNAMASPRQLSNSTTLTPAAQAEVAHNRATLLDATGATSLNWDTLDGGDGISRAYTLAGSLLGSVFTGSQTTYVPNTAGGLQATAAFADVWTTAGTLLQPVNAHLELVGVHSTATMHLPADGGSVATSQIDIGKGEAPSNNQLGYASCWTSSAQYSATGGDVSGDPVACPAGSMPSGVGAGGGMATAPGTDSHVYADNHPAAAPTLMVSSVTGQDGLVTLGSAYAASHNVLGWSGQNGLTSYSSMYALNVQAALSGLSISVDVIDMTAAVSVNAQGQTAVRFVCTPASVGVTNTVTHLTTTVHVDSSCSAPGLAVAGISLPFVQPSATPVCATNATTGVVSCSYQTCFLRATVATLPNPTTLCLGEDDVVLGGTPVSIGSTGCTTSCCTSACGGSTTSASSSTSSASSSTSSASSSATSAGSNTSSASSSTSSASTSSASSSTSSTTSSTTTAGGGIPPSPWFTQFTGTVTVSAQVDQPTYFLNVLGWAHTTPAATASADLEPVVDESQAAFTASPFAMPDSGTNMSAPFRYEHLRPGQTYYLYGPAMQTDNPSPVMPGSWQGQLTATSPHRVGATVAGAVTTTTTPQPYLNHGPYWLVPIFDPVTGLVESYGVFIPVTGHANWGTLVNSLPAFAGQPNLHGYVVQATSLPGWITFDEGAVSVKLLQ